MLTVPLAILMVLLHFFFAEERTANRLAHEVCPNTHVVRVDDRFQFTCDGHDYVVLCDDGQCAIEPL